MKKLMDLKPLELCLIKNYYGSLRIINGNRVLTIRGKLLLINLLNYSLIDLLSHRNIHYKPI